MTPVTCEECGLAIPAKRLIAVPSATRCVGCQAGVDELLVASPNMGASAEGINGADFLIVRKRSRQSDLDTWRELTGRRA